MFLRRTTSIVRTLPLTLSIALCSGLGAQQFCDSTMQLWSSTSLQLPGADCQSWNTVGAVGTGIPGAPVGNPAPGLRFAHQFNLGSLPGTTPYSIIHLLHVPTGPGSALTFGPCPPWAAKIDLAIDYRAEAYLPLGAFGSSIGFRWAAVQNGHTYLCDRCGTTGSWQTATANLNWARRTDLGLSPALFTEPVTGTVLDLAAGPVRFGVVSTNSCPSPIGCGFAQSAFGQLDNFCASVHVLIGPGCPGTLGVPGNEPGEAHPGGSFVDRFTRIPYGLAVYVVGFDCELSNFGFLPFDLTNLGAPGCYLRTSLDLVGLASGNAPMASFTIDLSFAPPGLRFYTQGFSVDPGANAFWYVASDAALVIVQ